jgi:hypothetical protein
MKPQRIFVFHYLLLAFVLFASGCASTNPEKLAQQVKGWVPIGTSAKEAERIMTRHSFECHRLRKDNPFNPLGSDYLGCDRQNYRLHDWSVKLLLQDEKVVGYGPISIDETTISAP